MSPRELVAGVAPELQRELFERVLDVAEDDGREVRLSAFNAPHGDARDWSVPREWLRELLDDFGDRHHEARRRCLIVGAPEVREYDEFAVCTTSRTLEGLRRYDVAAATAQDTARKGTFLRRAMAAGEDGDDGTGTAASPSDRRCT